MSVRHKLTAVLVCASQTKYSLLSWPSEISQVFPFHVGVRGQTCDLEISYVYESMRKSKAD